MSSIISYLDYRCYCSQALSLYLEEIKGGEGGGVEPRGMFKLGEGGGVLEPPKGWVLQKGRGCTPRDPRNISWVIPLSFKDIYWAIQRLLQITSRSSSREVRIRVPLFP